MKASSQAMINFLTGWPNPSLLPAHSIRDASNVILSAPDISTPVLQYGPDPGYQPLREEIARWLTSFFVPREGISSKRICITGGASQNLACTLQVFTDPLYTRNIWMVAPTYYLACRIFDDAGFAGKLRGVPEDEEGIDIGNLSKQIQISEDRAITDGLLNPTLKPVRPWRKIYKHVIYAVPTFANPSGKLMTLSRREALVRVARDFDALIITDDVYDALQWPAATKDGLQYSGKACVPRVVDVDKYLDGGPNDEFGNSVSNGSFTKLVGPGCRTGWAEGTEAFAYGLSQTGSSRSGGCPSQLAASFIYELLATSSLQKHIRHDLQPAYARRYHKLMSAISDYLVPLGVNVVPTIGDVAGGYFIWLTFPEPLKADDVAERALSEENVKIAQGSLFKVQGDQTTTAGLFEREFRLCFSWLEEDFLAEGVQRLANLVQRLLVEARESRTV